MTTQERLQDLRRKVSDAATAVDVLFSPFEVQYRESLNPGARRAAEVGVCNAVSALEAIRRAHHAAQVSFQLEEARRYHGATPDRFKAPDATCDRCGKTGMIVFVATAALTKKCFRCGGGTK